MNASIVKIRFSGLHMVFDKLAAFWVSCYYLIGSCFSFDADYFKSAPVDTLLIAQLSIFHSNIMM